MFPWDSRRSHSAQRILTAAVIAATAAIARAGTVAVAVKGDVAPGGGTFASLGSSTVYLGQFNSVVAFTASIADPTVASRSGLFTYTPTTGNQLIVRSGDSALGLTPSQVSLGAIDESGRVASWIAITGGGSGVFASPPAGAGTPTVSLVARTGLTAPGGGTFSTVLNPVASNGYVAFAGG